MTDDDSERKTMMRPTLPARPKDAAPEPTAGSVRVSPCALAAARPAAAALARPGEPARFEFAESTPQQMDLSRNAVEDAIARGAVMEFREVQPDPFAAFAEIMGILRKFPKPVRKQMVGVIAELLLE